MSLRNPVSCMMAAVLAAALAGCRTPTNVAQLTALSSLNQVGEYPPSIQFDHGTFVSRGDRGAAWLTSEGADMLFYYKGPRNRFELDLRRQGQSATYTRIGERPMMLAAGRQIPRPVGIEVLREDRDTLEIAVDVAVALQDAKGYGSAFEHYPRNVRVRGTFTLQRYGPRSSDPPGPPSYNRLLLILPPDEESPSSAAEPDAR